MKVLYTVSLVTMITWQALAAPLPPKDLQAPFKELNAKGFEKWKIKEFHGWAIPFDGGSTVFFFETETGRNFDVMAANPAYWNREDKERRQQVFYIIFESRFFLLEPESKAEAALLKMLKSAQPGLSGTGKKDPSILSGLMKQIRDRKPMFKLE